MPTSDVAPSPMARRRRRRLTTSRQTVDFVDATANDGVTNDLNGDDELLDAGGAGAGRAEQGRGAGETSEREAGRRGEPGVAVRPAAPQRLGSSSTRRADGVAGRASSACCLCQRLTDACRRSATPSLLTRRRCVETYPFRKAISRESRVIASQEHAYHVLPRDLPLSRRREEDAEEIQRSVQYPRKKPKTTIQDYLLKPTHKTDKTPLNKCSKTSRTTPLAPSKSANVIPTTTAPAATCSKVRCSSVAAPSVVAHVVASRLFILVVILVVVPLVFTLTFLL